jgi:hypothetical protein
MGRGANKVIEFDLDEVSRLGFDADLPDHDPLIRKKFLNRLSSVAVHLDVGRRQVREFEELVPLIESVASNRLAKELLTEIPLQPVALKFLSALIRARLLGSLQGESLRPLLVRAVGITGGERMQENKIVSAAGPSSPVHLRSTEDSRATLCGEFIALNWRQGSPRGNFNSNSNKCKKCLAALKKLPADHRLQAVASANPGDTLRDITDSTARTISDPLRQRVIDTLHENRDSLSELLTDPSFIEKEATPLLAKYATDRLMKTEWRERWARMWDMYMAYGAPEDLSAVGDLCQQIEIRYGLIPPEPTYEQFLEAAERGIEQGGKLGRYHYLSHLARLAWPKAASDFAHNHGDLQGGEVRSEMVEIASS